MSAPPREEDYDWTKPVYMTEDEYLEFIETTDERYEFYDGWVRPLSKLIRAVPEGMAGGSEDHALLIANSIVAAHRSVEGKDCRVYSSDLHVKAKNDARWTFPDVSIVCGPSEKDERKKEAVNNPTVILEVLSPTTERYDRTSKFEKYTRIESLRHYVLIESDRPAIQVLTRAEAGAWKMEYHLGRDAVARLHDIGADLPLRTIYENLEFDAEAEAAGQVPPPEN